MSDMEVGSAVERSEIFGIHLRSVKISHCLLFLYALVVCTRVPGRISDLRAALQAHASVIQLFWPLSQLALAAALVGANVYFIWRQDAIAARHYARLHRKLYQ